MSLYNKASLIQVPSLYKDGLLVSTVPEDRSGDFAVARGANLSATRIGEDGYIKKGYENLLLQSNSFLTSPWSSIRASLTGSQEGYDGSNDAWLLESTDGTLTSLVKQDINPTGVKTISVYAKSNTANWILLYAIGGGLDSWFDVQNGATGGKGSGAISSSIESVGNDWWRCSVTTNNSITDFRIYVADANNSFNSVLGSSVYIQDAMLNQGLVAYPYIETTTAPVAVGILEDTPRLDWASGAPSLLLEPSRTNLVGYSELINPTIATSVWKQLGANTFTSNYGTAPDGTQTSTRVQFGTGNSSSQLYAIFNTSAADYTGSIYLKGSGVLKFGFYDNSSLLTDTITLTSEWKRFDVTKTLAATSGARFWIYPEGAGAAQDFEIWGAQCEQASYPTSYIPTYGVSQTRLVDNCRLTSAENIIGQSAGTIFSKFIPLYSDGAQLVEIAGGTSNRIFTKDEPNGAFRIDLNANGVGIVNYTSPTGLLTEGSENKFALTYSAVGYALYINGSKITSGTNPIVFNAPVDEVFLNRNISQNVHNNNNGKHNELLLFPTVLSDAECIALTKID